jgi:Ca-activated chloride channel family protein
VSFAWPILLWLAALVPALGLVAGWVARRRARRFAAVFSGALLERVLPASVRRRRTVRGAATAAGLALALVALAEPRFAKPPHAVKARGTDIVVLLDLSRSMDATDVDPSRLVRARREIEDLQRIVEGDRLGLVIYAAAAHPRLPLTSDLRALSMVTAEVSTDTFENQGSNLGEAIDAGLALLARSEDRAGKALLVLSDGETHHPDEALAAAGRAAEARVPIFAVGIGVAEAPIPLRSGGVLRDGDQVVLTRPDFEILEQAAAASGGAFVTSSASTKDLEALYAELRRTVTAVERETRQGATHDSAYQWPLAAGAAALLFAALLGDGRRTLAAALALAVLLGGARPAVAASLAEADRAYRAESWEEAARQLTELTRAAPHDPDLWDRLGAARYRAGDFEGAAQAWDRAAAQGGGSDAWYNAGNAHYQAGRLEDAVSRYERALDRDAQHVAAANNRDVVTQEIAARRAQKPPPPPKPDDGEKEGDGGEGQEDPNQAGGDQQGDDPDASSEGQGDDPQQPQSEQGQGGGEPGQPSGEGQGQGAPDQGPSPDGQGQGQPGGQEGGGAPAGAPGQGGGSGGEAVPITAAQAERMIDGVEEGKPRTTVRGRPEDKPW